MYQMARDESVFQGEFPLSFKMLFEPYGVEYDYHKISDVGQCWQMYDAHCWFENKGYIGLEYKMNYAKKTINVCDMFSNSDEKLGRKHQYEKLIKRIQCGHLGFVMINWFALVSSKNDKGKKVEKWVNRAFALSPFTAKEYAEGPTVNMDQFINDPRVIELERKSHLGRYYWDLTNILRKKHEPKFI